jgi:peptidoglycan/LPS O-acetylase OafA/YrhL
MVLLMDPSRSAPAFVLGPDRAGQSFLQVAVGVLALAPLALRSASVPFLSSRPMVAMAALSFGFFLWHIQTLRVARPLLQEPGVIGWLGLALAFGLALLAGELSRRYVEAPARRLIVGR